MNAQINAQTLNRRRDDRRASSTATPIRAYREREFGVGYGRSSGYAADRRYTRRTYTSLYHGA
ncbi:hypothetical protein [Marilutibacter chinensis]|uniref:Uncharacterized protein n=1 Tax=Marilutibacter chinensis TaxID=2912247 RepID=A0ABS9HVI1_9GAMM|nr:hypothetical protein [Lysobacter chinensis]MCF7222901.1 hypothetical protein [Lysobacter chinensis]